MAQLDNIIRQPARLQIMSSLIAFDLGEQVDFVYPRKIVTLTERNSGSDFMKSKNAANRR
ncbi:MAG: hypothetical protein ACYTEQ_10865 [Planctomycetota bacterium]